MSLYKTEALVLRVRDFQEADKIVTLLSPQHGKLEAVARGARRPRSRLAGATQAFTRLDCLLWKGKNLDTVSQVEIRESLRELREDLTKMAYATYFTELVDRMVQVEDPHDGLYSLLYATLRLLADGQEAQVLRWTFELHLLSLLGYRPRLDACAGCDGPVEEAAGGPDFFSPSRGGLVCARCAPPAAARKVARGTIETMRRLLATDPQRAAVVRAQGEIAGELRGVLREYIGHRLEGRLRSLDFLSGLLGEDATRG